MKDYYQVLLIGASGKGKTYSFRNMNPLTTAFINIENKPLPFKNEFKYYSKPTTTAEVKAIIARCNEIAEIDCVVVDSMSAYFEMLLAEARTTKKNFDVWNLYNEEIGKFCKILQRLNKHSLISAHYEWIQDEGGARERRVKIKGKEWEGLIEKEFTVVLYADRTFDSETKKVNAWFDLALDNSSSKCPPMIFGEDVFRIENDSNIILQKINLLTE